MEKTKVMFAGGESRNENAACNYMSARVEYPNYAYCPARLEEAELYAEILESDFESTNGQFDTNAFNDYSYPLLKEEIIRQAEEYGIPKEHLEFWWG